MSGQSVCVLAPNGRRQTVKCTPNTTILQIIEEVCKKQGLKAEEYDIKHHNKVLDTTTTFRFSGLPNNAQLELTGAIKVRADTDVTLAVNLENGNRLMGNFNPNSTLLDVLMELCPDNVAPDKRPVVIYTRREMFGDDLAKITLKSLGITGGRAMVRVIHRAPEELKIQANVSAPLPSKPVEEKPYKRTFQKLDSPPRDSEMSTSFSEKKDDYSKNRIDNDAEEIVRPSRIQKNDAPDILKLAKEKRKKDTSPTFNERSPSSPTKSVLKLRKNEESAMEIDTVPENVPQPPIEREISIEDEFVFLGDRHAMLFSLQSAQSVPSEELPDDFFNLTIDDARRILKDLKKKQSDMDEAPLMTSALRNLEHSKGQLRSLNKYKQSIIRVLFPDQTVLQGTFSPVDTIQDVINFVREYLEDKNLDFYVYFTPPKCILDKESRLIEVGCVPGALLHFGTEYKDNDSKYLRKDLQDKFTTNSLASLAATKMRKLATRHVFDNQTNDIDYEVEESIQGPSQICNNMPSTSSGVTNENWGGRPIKTTENVPKWFKTSK